MDEHECLLGKDNQKKEAGFVNAVFSSSKCFPSGKDIGTKPTAKDLEILASAIERVRTRETEDSLGNMQIVIELRSGVSCRALRSQLQFLYTGELPKEIPIPTEVILVNLPEHRMRSLPRN